MKSRAFLFWGRAGLEKNLQAELRIEGFTSTDTWSSVVVTDGVIQTEVSTYGAVWWRIVDTVEEVEHLRPELNGHQFLDLRVLEDGKIYVGISRAVITVTTRRSKVTGVRVGK